MKIRAAEGKLTWKLSTVEEGRTHQANKPQVGRLPLRWRQGCFRIRRNSQSRSYGTGFRRVSPTTVVSFESPEDPRTLRDPGYSERAFFSGKFPNCTALTSRETANNRKGYSKIVSKSTKCAREKRSRRTLSVENGENRESRRYESRRRMKRQYFAQHRVKRARPNAHIPNREKDAGKNGTARYFCSASRSAEHSLQIERPASNVPDEKSQYIRRICNTRLLHLPANKRGNSG